MIKIMKKSMLLLVILLFFQCSILAFALDNKSVPTLEAIELPPDLNFTVSHSCSGHAFFMQATANESGYFAIFTLHVNPDDLSDVDFKKVYIDIYQPDGTFLQELSFTTPLALTVALEENHVNIVFDNTVLVYDFVTQELSHIAIPTEATGNNGTPAQWVSKNFSVGDWDYTCKKGFLGYVKLSRTNGEQEQVLVEMPGNHLYLQKLIIPGSAAAGAIIMITVYCRKKRVENK